MDKIHVLSPLICYPKLNQRMKTNKNQMMKSKRRKLKLWISALLLFSISLVNAQENNLLTIEHCYHLAEQNYPLIKQYALLDQSRDYNLQNAARAWLPQIALNAKATYQSDVVKIPIDFSQLPLQGLDIPELNKDQYGITLDITQNLWDGGATKARSEQIKAQSQVESEQLNVSLYAVKERINQLFFGILMSDALLDQNRILQHELAQSYAQVKSLIGGGLANQSDLDAVKVEQLKAKQLATQVTHNRKAYLTMLSAFIGQKLDEQSELQKPLVQSTLPKENLRPELSLFERQSTLFETQNQMVKADLMPKLGFFLTGGYGNPGLNMLKEGFTPYYIGGLRMSWNISSFYTYKNRLEVIKKQQDNLAVQRETFLFNSDLQATSKQHELDKYRDLLADDDEIITLRQSVKRATVAKMNNGTANINDLIRETNAEALAKQNKIMHELELLQAIYNLKYITNN